MRKLRYPWRLTLYSEREPQSCHNCVLQRPSRRHVKDGPVVQETARLVGKMGKKSLGNKSGSLDKALSVGVAS